MKIIALLFLATMMAIGCSKEQRGDKTASQGAVEPDNSRRNARDGDNQTKTAGDQSESEVDRAITQKIRDSVTADDTLSTNGKNVKIITVDGSVTLRGPVQSEKEKADIEAKAKKIAGVKNVDNQLEIAS